MGILHQNPCSFANSPKLTISMWVKLNSYPIDSTLAYSFFDFGSTSDAVQGGSCSAGLVVSATDPDINNVFVMSFQGAGDSINMAENVAGDATTSLYEQYQGYGSIWYPRVNFGARPPAGMVVGKWFHLMVAADFSIPTISPVNFPTGPGDFTSAPSLKVFVNAVNFDSTSNPDNLPGSGKVQTRAYPDQANSGVPWGIAQTEPPFGDTGEVQVIVPAWDIDISGSEFAIPIRQDFASDPLSPPVSYSNVQIYVGQYIDPALHVGAFVNLVGGHGTPQPSSVAAGLFGPQTVLFEGGKTTFIDNQGTGGPFTVVGTVSDDSLTAGF